MAHMHVTKNTGTALLSNWLSTFFPSAVKNNNSLTRSMLSLPGPLIPLSMPRILPLTSLIHLLLCSSSLNHISHTHWYNELSRYGGSFIRCGGGGLAASQPQSASAGHRLRHNYRFYVEGRSRGLAEGSSVLQEIGELRFPFISSEYYYRFPGMQFVVNALLETIFDWLSFSAGSQWRKLCF